MFTFSGFNIHWVWLAVLSAVFAGATSVIAKVGLKKMDSNVATALRTIVVLLFCWGIVSAKGAAGQISGIDRQTWILLILSGVATGASWLCYFKALQMANVNRVAPIDKLSTVLTMVLAILFFHESVTRNKVIAIILLTAGILCMSFVRESGGRKASGGWWIYAVLSAVFASLTAILGKLGMQQIDSDLGTAIRTGVVLVMAWIMVFVTRHGKDLKNITLYHTLFILLSGGNHGAVLALLFPGPSAGGGQRGGAYRQDEHCGNHPVCGHFPEGASEQESADRSASGGWGNTASGGVAR